MFQQTVKALTEEILQLYFIRRNQKIVSPLVEWNRFKSNRREFEIKCLYGEKSLRSPPTGESFLHLKSKVVNWSFTFSPKIPPVAFTTKERGQMKSLRPRCTHLHAEHALSAAELSHQDQVILERSYFSCRSHLPGSSGRLSLCLFQHKLSARDWLCACCYLSWLIWLLTLLGDGCHDPSANIASLLLDKGPFLPP